MPLFDNKIKFRVSYDGFIRVIAMHNVTTRDIVNILNIDYNKIDFGEVIRAFNNFETFKKQLGDFYLEFL